MLKRRTIGAVIGAGVMAAGTYWAGASLAAPTDQPNPPPPVTTEDGSHMANMDAMMQTCVEQMPPELRDQAWQMHQQMNQMMQNMGGQMMPGGMAGPMMGGQ